MFEDTIGRLPERWRDVAGLFLAPIVWIPRLQSLLIDFFVDTSSGWVAAAKYVLLAFPTLLGLTALWCTQLSLYTLPFRSRRTCFISTLVVTWWGAALAVVMYWVGLIRLVLVLVTAVSLTVKHVLQAALRFVLRPASGRRLPDPDVRPGVPWLAVGLLVCWCALEALVFTWTMLPTLAQAQADLVGTDDLPRAAGPLVWCFLFLLAMASFVCIQVLVDAIKKRAFTFIVLSVLVELFVMFFEVVFLYRGLAEAILPWIVQQTAETFRPGAWFTLSVARFGWTGVRGMAWFLFGQYGTPPLLRLLSRQPMARGEGASTLSAPRARRSHASSEDVTEHLAWFRDEGDRLLEYPALPVLHVLAAGLNFAMVVVAAQPLFSLPFTGLTEAFEPRTAGYDAARVESAWYP